MLTAIRSIVAGATLAGILIGGVAMAQPKDPAPPLPYKKVAVSLPGRATDPALEAFRKQLADVAKRKDRAALAALVVPKGFFWEHEGNNGADDNKAGIDNFAAVIGLDAKDGSGWDFIADYAAEMTASPIADQKDMVCAPGNPIFSDDGFNELVKATDSNPVEWGYPVKDGIEARDGVDPDSPLVEKLGMHFIRVVFDESPPESAEPMLRIETPSGKLAYIPAELLSPLGLDQLCYLKQGNTWKIVGYVGEGAAK